MHAIVGVDFRDCLLSSILAFCRVFPVETTKTATDEIEKTCICTSA